MNMQAMSEAKQLEKEMLGKRVGTVRSNAGYSQKELATHLAVSVNTVQRYESGSLNIPTLKAVAIAEFLNIDLNDLIKAQ